MLFSYLLYEVMQSKSCVPHNLPIQSSLCPILCHLVVLQEVLASASVLCCDPLLGWQCDVLTYDDGVPLELPNGLDDLGVPLEMPNGSESCKSCCWGAHFFFKKNSFGHFKRLLVPDAHFLKHLY